MYPSMDCDKFTVLISGHSYISSLRDHLAQLHATSPLSELSAFAACHLKVDNKVKHVFMHGIRGAKVCQNTDIEYTLPGVTIRNIRPDIVIIDLGTNDLVSGKQPHEVMDAIEEVCTTLLTTYRVRYIVLCSVLKRTTHIMDTEEFSDLAYELNNCMKNYCSTQPRINFHTHRGFWKTPNLMPLHVTNWSRDGVHPNNPSGRRLYKASLRRAIMEASSVLLRGLPPHNWYVFA